MKDFICGMKSNYLQKIIPSKSFYFFQRHVVTAAHCICPDLRMPADDGNEHYTHDLSLCKLSNERNQITTGFNEVKIYGGYMDKNKLTSSKNAKKTFNVEYAFVKFRETVDSWIGGSFIDSKDDFALLVSDRPLFDKDKLKTLYLSGRYQEIGKPPILPICLAAKNTNIDKEKIFGVGWGSMYDLTPLSKDPYYSSCMTNQAGPKDWTFEPCDMDFIKTNNWACEKKGVPSTTSYNAKVFSECRNYFAKARRILDKKEIEFLDNVDKIYIQYQKDPNQGFLTCYNEKQLFTNGWCQIHDEIRSEKAWGFCSPSCEESLLKV